MQRPFSTGIREVEVLCMCSENLAEAASREQNVWILCWRDAIVEALA